MLPDPCWLEPASAPLLPPVAPSLPNPHTFSQRQLCSRLCTALLPRSSRSCLSPLFQSTAQPHQSNRWHCCHLQEAVWVLSEGLQLLSGLCLQGGKMGGRDLLLYSLPLWGEEFFCAAFPVPLSLLLLPSVTARALSCLWEAGA